MTLHSRISVSVTANQSETLDLGSRSSAMTQTYKANLSDGTGAGQADRVFHDQRTLAASATENLDLAGVLTDPLGTSLTFARIKAIVVKAAAGNTNDVIMGGDVTNTFFGPFADETDGIRIRPGGVVCIACGEADSTGYTVAAGTGDLLKFLNGGGSTPVTFDVTLIGASA
jgi:hypothetical protein